MDPRVSGNANASQSGLTSSSGDQTPHAQRSPGDASSSTPDPRLQGLPRLPGVAQLRLRAVPSSALGGTAPPSSQPQLLVSDVPVAVAWQPAPRAVRSSSAAASSSRLTSRAIRASGTPARNPLRLSPDEIDRIGRARSGRVTLAYIERDGRTLTQPPFDYARNDIIRIATNPGASQALRTVRALDHALRALGYSQDDIVRIAAKDGGSQALRTVRARNHALRALGYSKDDIVRIAAHHGGSQALQTVYDLEHALRALGYSKNDIVRMAANNGGSQALHAVRDLGSALRALGYTNDDIADIAANIGGSPTLQTVLALDHALRALGYAKDDIVKIAANGGGSKALRALQEHHDALVARGSTKNHIMTLARQHRGASAALKRAAGAS